MCILKLLPLNVKNGSFIEIFQQRRNTKVYILELQILIFAICNANIFHFLFILPCVVKTISFECMNGKFFHLDA